MSTKTKVYDWPTRMFHWIFAFCTLAAFAIAKTVDDESAKFQIHMLLGILAVVAVALRILWGIVGSKHAQFGSFRLNPLDLINYFKNLLSKEGTKDAGHNPASSWAAILFFLLVIGLGFSGYLMTLGKYKEVFEEVHEVFANSFIILAVLHVLGIAVHSIVHRDAIGLSMIHGNKLQVDTSQGIERSHPGIAALFLLAMMGSGFLLYKNYDSNSQKLQLFGTAFNLGKNSENSNQKTDHHESESDD